MARAAIEDPIKVFRYRVIVDGFVRAGFSEVTGLESDTEEAKYREGGFNETMQKSAGLSNHGDITLRRGQLIGTSRGGDDDFIIWATQVFNVAAAGNAANYRKDLDIEQYGPTNLRVRAWRVYNCWPKKFKPMSDLKADASDNSFEEIVLTQEGWEKVL